MTRPVTHGGAHDTRNIGKERVLRFPRISRFIGSTPATLLALASITLGLAGCENNNSDPIDWNPIAGMTPNSLNLRKGFLDQSETASTVRPGGPLLVPILDKLNTNIDEIGPEFVNATDVRPEDLTAQPSDYTVSRNDLVQVSINDLQAIGSE